MTFLRLNYKPLDEGRDRVVVDIVDKEGGPNARWVFHDGDWKRTAIIQFGKAQIAVTNTNTNQTWTFNHSEIEEAFTAAKTLHGRVVQR